MKILTLCLLAIAAALACRADEIVKAGVTLTGVVADPSGSVVPGTALTLINRATGAQMKAEADAQGQFRFETVPAGEYTLKANATGFAAVEMPVKVGGEAPPPLRVRMEIQASTQNVTVTAEDEPDLDLAPAASSNADSLRIEDNTLLQLPAQTGDVLGAVSNFLSPAAQGAVGPSIVVDGVETDAFDVPAWSIKRIRIDKNPYSAEFRRPGKSRIEVTTHNGRSRLHGGYSIFARNSGMDARNALAATKPDMSQGLAEVHATGPVGSGPLYYFFSGERLLDRQTSIVNALTLSGPLAENAPTPLYRTTMLGRLDYHRSRMHMMNLRYSSQETVQHGRGVGGFVLPQDGYPYGQHNNTLQFADRYIASARLSNNFRATAERTETHSGAPATGPAIIVQGAFQGGAPQEFRFDRETTFRVQDGVNYYVGRHKFQFGGQFRPRFINTRLQNNFGGTFEFSKLNSYADGSPFVYRVDQGNPMVSFTAPQGYDYVQDQIQIRPDMSLLAGFRHEWQSNLHANGNREAPRLSVAYAPGNGKTVLRAGAGLFYETLPKTVTRQDLLYDGTRVRQYVVANPSYPDPLAAGPLALTPQSVVRVAPNLGVPMLMQASFAIEQGLGKHAQLTLDYQRLRGVHLYRTRNINAPLPVSGVVPDPAFMNVIQVESSGRSLSNAIDVTLRWNASRFTGMAQYTLSRSRDDAYSLFSLPANNYDLRPEWGPSDYDRRHQFNLMGSAQLPFNFRLATITTLGSALPYNITTGKDIVALKRPPGVSRNTGRGANLARVDLRLAKAFRLKKNVKSEDDKILEFSVDAFNVFNRTNYDRYVGLETSPFFGHANVALAPRTLQTGVRFNW